MRLSSYISIISVLISFNLNAQVSINVTNPPGCFGSTYDLEADVTGSFGTDSYSFETIPYAPEAYAGAPIFLSDDDVSAALPIGFSFCFLGNTYTQFYIGSNGWISFSAGQSTAYTSAAIPSTSPAVPKNAIMGPWEDWNPGIGGQVMFQTIGTAPNRKLVVSWQNVPMFSCTGNLGSFQIVCHETTGIIENHLTNKPNCPTWAGGTGTQGVHDATGTIAFTAPGRNSTQWTTSNESTRFVPSGVTWLQQGGTQIGVGDTVQVTPTTPTWYYAEVTLCDGSSYIDSVQLNPGPIATLNEIDALCSYSNDGSATVLVDGIEDNTNYTYTWNDPMAQDSSTAIGLAPGTYVVDIVGPSGCTAQFNVSIGSAPAIDFSYTPSPACNGAATGALWLQVVGGTSPFQYSIDNGATFSTDSIFQSLLPINYDVSIIDANGCQLDTLIAVPGTTSPVVTNVTLTNPSCVASDGNIDLSATGIDGPFQYSIDGGLTTQPTGVFANLGVGTYTISISNVYGCTTDTTVDLTNPQAPILDNVLLTDPSCGATDGAIDIQVSGGTAPYQYSIDGGTTFQSTSQYTNLPGATYDITVTDDNGCSATTTVSLIPGDEPTILSTLVTDPVCVGDSGCVEVLATGGVPTLQYSFDNGATWQPGNTLCGLDAGTYNVWVEGGNGCSDSTTVSIAAPDTVIAAFTATPPNGSVPLDVEFTNTSVGATSYIWSFGDGDSSTVTDPDHTYSPKGDYTVILTATNGPCTDTASFVIQVTGESNIIVPNIITANGDGINDEFAPVLTNIASFECWIYNIWGQQVYYWNGLNGSWDGSGHADGTYYYSIIAVGADGTTYNLSGFFTKTS